MKVSEIKIRKTFSDKGLKALASVVINDSIAIHDIKILQLYGKMLIAMPNEKDKQGRNRDIVHPMNAEARETLEKAILNAYNACNFD